MVKQIKGDMHFYIKEGKVVYEKTDYAKLPEWEKFNKKSIFETHDLMRGLNFASNVECGGFIDCDGSIVNIYIDDYKTNLGIWDYGIHQGEFCVALSDFKELCKNFKKVEVDWENK